MNELPVVGTKIRRKNKKKSQKNNHPIFTITGYSQVCKDKNYGSFQFVGLVDSNGKVSSMSVKGLDWYEIVRSK